MLTGDDAKNRATAAAILAGGSWTRYRWNALFPKTTSGTDVSVAADPETPVHIRFPVRLQLALTGNAPVAVRVAGTDFRIVPVNEDISPVAAPAPGSTFKVIAQRAGTGFFLN